MTNYPLKLIVLALLVPLCKKKNKLITKKFHFVLFCLNSMYEFRASIIWGNHVIVIFCLYFDYSYKLSFFYNVMHASLFFSIFRNCVIRRYEWCLSVYVENSSLRKVKKSTNILINSLNKQLSNLARSLYVLCYLFFSIAGYVTYRISKKIYVNKKVNQIFTFIRKLPLIIFYVMIE